MLAQATLECAAGGLGEKEAVRLPAATTLPSTCLRLTLAQARSARRRGSCQVFRWLPRRRLWAQHADMLQRAHRALLDPRSTTRRQRRRAADGANWIMGKMERMRIGLDVAGALLGMFEVRNESM